MMTIAAVVKTNFNGTKYFEAAEPLPETATSVVFNGNDYVVYEGDEPVEGE